MEIDVFTTSVYNNRVSSHSPLHDSRLLAATLHFLIKQFQVTSYCVNNAHCMHGAMKLYPTVCALKCKK